MAVWVEGICIFQIKLVSLRFSFTSSRDCGLKSYFKRLPDIILLFRDEIQRVIKKLIKYQCSCSSCTCSFLWSEWVLQLFFLENPPPEQNSSIEMVSSCLSSNIPELWSLIQTFFQKLSAYFSVHISIYIQLYTHLKVFVLFNYSI